MGFLDHTTSNIIVDAVLTEKGREKLASANGLSINKYAFADDEVDYTLLVKYGEIVGKEKIEKNTPIFEAITDHTRSYSLLQDNTGNLVSSITTVLAPSNLGAVSTGNTLSVTLQFTNFEIGSTHSYLVFFNNKLLNVTANSGFTPTVVSGDISAFIASQVISNAVQSVVLSDVFVINPSSQTSPVLDPGSYVTSVSAETVNGVGSINGQLAITIV